MPERRSFLTIHSARPSPTGVDADAPPSYPYQPFVVAATDYDDHSLGD
jgi:hypothetical protein